MAWSGWSLTSPGRYVTENLNTSSVGTNSEGLPNSPSIPSLPTSPNCSYTVYGVWQYLIDGVLYNPSETLGRIAVYTQTIYNGQIFQTYGIGLPTYHKGKWTGDRYGIDFDTSATNKNIQGAIGYGFNSAFNDPYLFSYGEWDITVRTVEIVFIGFYAQGLINCDFSFSPTTYTPRLYLGNAAPPPPPPSNMPCCDCNTIATIIAENTIAELKQHEATRDHIDRRTLEGLREINKMLQGMAFNINLQPVIDRLNELEANLWNGLKAN